MRLIELIERVFGARVPIPVHAGLVIYRSALYKSEKKAAHKNSPFNTSPLCGGSNMYIEGGRGIPKVLQWDSRPKNNEADDCHTWRYTCSARAGPVTFRHTKSGHSGPCIKLDESNREILG